MPAPRSWPAGLLALAACSPALNWREVRPEGGGVVLMLPCKPDVRSRQLRLAGRSVRLTLLACGAADATWALAAADIGDPALVGAALDELRGTAAVNLGAASPPAQAFAVPGATPNPSSARAALSGRLPDGKAVHEQIAVFARGTWVFQATVVGEQLPADGVEVFFTSIRVVA